MDISNTLAPNSDQLDAVDLLSGPRIFTIESVNKGDVEQPVNIHLVDFPRPWRPGKSMRRVLVACWGPDAAKYIGRRVELFCDPNVVFGGLAVGGTRVSRLSHIDKKRLVPLLISRGKSAMFTVQPLPDAPPIDLGNAPEAPPEKSERAKREGQMWSLFTEAGYNTKTEKERMLAFISTVCGRPITSRTDIDDEELASVIAELQLEKAGPPPDAPADSWAADTGGAS